MGLNAGDRKLMMAAAGIVLALVIAIALLSPPASSTDSQFPSSYASDARGALAAYLLLTDLHYDVHRWEEPPNRLNEVESGAVLILAEPNQEPTDEERVALREFVRRGGRILFCGSLQEFFADAPVRTTYTAGSEIFTAQLPSYATADADTIRLRPRATWTDSALSDLTLYGNQHGAAVKSWKIEDGEVVWWAAADPLTNYGLSQAQNLRLFLNAVSASTSAQGKPTIYWDEYYHGQRASLWSYVEKTPAAWGLLQLGVLLAAIVFSFSRRSGPLVHPARESRLSPLEFVDTLGRLYQSAGAGSVAVSVAYRTLRIKLTQRLGVPLASPDAGLAEAAARRLSWNRDEFGACMAKASVAEHLENLRSAEAFELVRQLENYRVQLRPRKGAVGKNGSKETI